MMKTLFTTKCSSWLLIVVLLLCTNCIFAQTTNNGTVVITSDCELNSAYLDALLNEQKERGERIFVISRLGKKEKKSKNIERLTYTEHYIIERAKLEKEKTVFAEGSKTNDSGKLEFYLGSKLFLVIEMQKNSVGCYDCCEDNETIEKFIKQKLKAKNQN